MQKQKLNIDGDKSFQISTLVKKIVTQRWSQIMIMKSKQAIN